jgi:hypothetical protein
VFGAGKTVTDWVAVAVLDPEVTVTVFTYVPRRLIRTWSAALPFASSVPVTGWELTTPEGSGSSVGPVVVTLKVAPGCAGDVEITLHSSDETPGLSWFHPGVGVFIPVVKSPPPFVDVRMS